MARRKQSGCPIAQATMILGSRWTAQIVDQLLENGPRRYQDLQIALKGIAPNTLSARLKMLEKAGLVERRLYETHPPRAEYLLTDSGRKMNGVIAAMREWGASLGRR